MNPIHSWPRKDQIRKTLLQSRKQLTEAERLSKSDAVNKLLEKLISDLPSELGSQGVGVYEPILGEVVPELSWLRCRGPLLYPKVVGPELVFVGEPGAGTRNAMRSGPRSSLLWSPNPPAWAFLRRPGILIVPGVGFSPQGARLGYGKGFYDRYLMRIRSLGLPVVSIGLAYDFQILESFEQTELDQQIDFIVSESKVFRR